VTNDSTNPCQRGCGEPVKSRFVRGHHMRLPGAHRAPTPMTERIWANCRVDPVTGCWLWTLSVDKDGYGSVKVSGRTRHAYRESYEAFIGPVPAGLTIDHVCHTRDETCPGGRTCPHRACVNPAHMEPVTVRENIERGRSDHLRNFADYYAERRAATHCPNDHPWDEVNTRWTSTQRICRTCQREAMRRHRAKKAREAIADGCNDAARGDARP
jgi:hypothetical protein